MKLTLGQVADWVHAEGDFNSEAEATGYSIDSRTISAGDLFFAVSGERFNGHDFVGTALSDGAVAAVVSMRWLRPDDVDERKLLRVPDEDQDCVLHSLHTLARAVRRAWGKRVIGVTGSAGKTTTKECIAEALSTNFNVLKSAGNLNNHFGVPLQLLRLEPEHDVAVIEMGMNHAGEIRALTKIAEPDWAVVSNVAAVHLEFFPDGIAGIAAAKYELVEALPADGMAFLNGDDDRVAAFARGLGSRAVSYGTREGTIVRAIDVKDAGLDGTHFVVQAEGAQQKVHLRLLGRHNVLNALAAMAVALRSGVALEQSAMALEAMRASEKRGNVVHWNGAKIINDSYNSNPRALDAMVEALRHTKAQRRIVIAGEMLELGGAGEALHEACGRNMAGLDAVLGVRGLARSLVAGAQGRTPEALFVDTPEDAGAWMRKHLRAGDVVLLKASRGVRLEKALDALESESSQSAV